MRNDEHRVTTLEQLEQFQRDGYIVLSGLLTDADDEVDRLAHAGETIVQQRATAQYLTFSVVEKGVIFAENCFRDVAIRYKLGQVAAELMQLDPANQNCRILR
jgi:hypothetical protein